jgi:DNA invertase Pin-like site-specific DNA recombinase
LREPAEALQPLAFSYLRVSRSEQAEGGGLDRQGDMAAAWCEQNGFRLDAQLDLSDRGRSAYKGDHLSRGALGRFLELAKDDRLGPSPVLLIEAVDRLSRQEPLDALQQVVFALVEAGVQIVDLEDGRTYDRQSLQGDALLLLVLKCRAAHDYSKRLGRRLADHWQRVRDGIRSGQKVYRGEGGMHPFWLDLSEDKTAWVLNAAAEGVAAAFELLRTNGLLATAALLNEQGYAGPKGKPWSSHGVRRAVTDPAAKGDLVMFQTAAAKSERAHRRWVEAKATAKQARQRFTVPEPELVQTETVEGFYPAVVSPEVWLQTQGRMSERWRAPAARANRAKGVGLNLLEGLATCQGGGLMGITASRIRSTGELRHYLRCRLHRSQTAQQRANKPACSCCGRGWHLEPLMAHVLTRLEAHVLDRALIPGADGEAELRKVQAKLTAAHALETDAAKAVANASRVLEQAVEEGSFDLAENASGIVEKKRQAHRRAQSQVAELEREVELLSAQARPLEGLDASGLLKGIHRGDITQQQRNSLHRALKDAQLQVVLDDTNWKDNGWRVGMRFGGSAEYEWQPLAPRSRTLALREGVNAPARAEDTSWGARVEFFPGLFPDDPAYVGAVGLVEIDDPGDYGCDPAAVR